MKLETKKFIECQELIGKIKSGEILAASKEPKTADEINEIVTDEELKRKNIRENRLVKWQEMAEQDQKFQKAALEGMIKCQEFLEDSKESRDKLFSLLERMVVAMEKNNTTYLL